MIVTLFLGGGNKARKMMYLHDEIKSKKYDAIVTTGGIQSNHCRATALYCHKYNLDCTIVLHGKSDDYNLQSGNAKIMKKHAFEKLFFSEPDMISQNMDNAILNYKKDRTYTALSIWRRSYNTGGQGLH